ncbi:hypothetical protein C8J56DRAFT_251586 [Mycena floridula]|nr:hypothetical protein C8J56DRAFT_251586 [Mycena floridula]
MVQINVSSSLLFALVALSSASTMAAPTFSSEVSHKVHHRNPVSGHHSKAKLAGRAVRPTHHRIILPRKNVLTLPKGDHITPLKLGHGPVVHHRPIKARDVDDLEARALPFKLHKTIPVQKRDLETRKVKAPASPKKTHKAPLKSHTSGTDKLSVAVDAAGVAVDAATGIATAVKSRGLVEERDMDLLEEREFFDDE